ncbi:MAG: serine/threonine-protein kinase [Anaerolineae bacterium]|nr:serine/threonine-protein kinase [Anaerolineae bacterium]
MDNLSGQVIRGYELHELIGEGGFGAVYRATQIVVDREVAIKIILPQYANQPEFIRRFEAEAKTVARLDHLHIVSLFDYWRDPTGAYLVLHWLRGGTLKDYIAEHGALAPPTAARIFSQIAGALSTAHRLNVIHRDVKPANILLDAERNAYLADFGIAKSSLDDKSAPSKASSESALTGSAGYISPEQINLSAVTARSDIYSMAIGFIRKCLSGNTPIQKQRHPLPYLLSIRMKNCRHSPTSLTKLTIFCKRVLQKTPMTVMGILWKWHRHFGMRLSKPDWSMCNHRGASSMILTHRHS